MKFCLPLFILVSFGCVKNPKPNTEEIRLIERDTDILDEEDLEELPESQ
tara:strand:+ start:9428 stop:9574 length:147 start_codon:yes stop_codon:yes gene_type:complete